MAFQCPKDDSEQNTYGLKRPGIGQGSFFMPNVQSTIIEPGFLRDLNRIVGLHIS